MLSGAVGLHEMWAERGGRVVPAGGEGPGPGPSQLGVSSVALAQL